MTRANNVLKYQSQYSHWYNTLFKWFIVIQHFYLNTTYFNTMMKLTNITIRVSNTRFTRDSHSVILLDSMTIISL
jgi:hypothetical protein